VRQALNLLVDRSAVLREVEQTYRLNAGRGLPCGVEVVDEPARRPAA